MSYLKLALIFLLAHFSGCDAAVGQGQPCTSPGRNNFLTFVGTTQGGMTQAVVPSQPGNPPLDGFGEFAIEFWMRCSSNREQVIASKWGAAFGDQAWRVRMDSNGVVGFTLNGLPIELCDSGQPLGDGLWHHVAISRWIFDPTFGVVWMYVDGVQSPNVGGYETPVVSVAQDMQLGRQGGSSSSFIGDLDELRIWTTRRTVPEIQANRSYGVSPTTPGLVGYWRMDEGVGQTLPDLSGNGNDLIRGLSALPEGQFDPAWNSLAPSPMVYCIVQAGCGQSNDVDARLELNGVGAGNGQGPFLVNLPPLGTMNFAWSGPPNMDIALFAGDRVPASTDLGALGCVGIGSPPTFSDISLLFTSLSIPFFRLGPGGTGQQSFSLPMLPPGEFINLQGLIYQPGGGARLTAAFFLNVL